MKKSGYRIRIFSVRGIPLHAAYIHNTHNMQYTMFTHNSHNVQYAFCVCISLSNPSHPGVFIFQLPVVAINFVFINEQHIQFF